MMNTEERNWLNAHDFTEASPNTFTKTMSKMVEVAFHGEQESTFKVTVTLRDNGSYTVDYSKNGRNFKRKTYSFGWHRTRNAINETVDYAGFDLRSNDAPPCSHTRDQECENCTRYSFSDRTGTRVWCHGKTEEVAR